MQTAAQLQTSYLDSWLVYTRSVSERAGIIYVYDCYSISNIHERASRRWCRVNTDRIAAVSLEPAEFTDTEISSIYGGEVLYEPININKAPTLEIRLPEVGCFKKWVRTEGLWIDRGFPLNRKGESFNIFTDREELKVHLTEMLGRIGVPAEYYSVVIRDLILDRKER